MIRRWTRWGLCCAAAALAVLVGGCLRPAATAVPTPVIASAHPEPTAAAPAPPRSGGAALRGFTSAPTPPDRDLVALARRLRRGSPEASATPALPSTPAPGERRSFHAMDLTRTRRISVQATLRLASEHAYFYVEEGASVTDVALERAAREFEERIYPTVRALFGSEPLSASGDPRLTLLHARLSGSSYYSSGDQYPAAVSPFSNELTMVYLDIGNVQVGTRRYFATLAHELQHLVHWNHDRDEEAWVNEGLSELAADLTGYGASFVEAFLRNSNVQLTAWGEGQAALPQYGASYLFFRYLADHYGGPEALRDLVSEPLDGVEGVNAFLRRLGAGRDFDSVFLDWTLANLLQESTVPYGYRSLRLSSPAKADTLPVPGERAATVRQYGAHYLSVEPPPGGVLDIRFGGAASAALLPTSPPDGRRLWWSNRGDSIDTILTREFDLTRATQASLDFKLWYDLEESYDYGYAEVSTDGGATWQPLPGRYTTTADPAGLSYGPAYTGRSGGGAVARWVEEQVDLTPFVGRRALVRFEVVTDDAYNRPGLALDDIALRAAGFFDDAESDKGWQAAGFVRTDNLVPQRYSVRLVVPGSPARIIELPLDAQNQGSLRVSLETPATLVVTALAPVTTEPASYTIVTSAPTSSGG